MLNSSPTLSFIFLFSLSFPFFSSFSPYLTSPSQQVVWRPLLGIFLFCVYMIGKRVCRWQVSFLDHFSQFFGISSSEPSEEFGEYRHCIWPRETRPKGIYSASFGSVQVICCLACLKYALDLSSKYSDDEAINDDSSTVHVRLCDTVNVLPMPDAPWQCLLCIILRLSEWRDAVSRVLETNIYRVGNANIIEQVCFQCDVQCLFEIFILFFCWFIRVWSRYSTQIFRCTSPTWWHGGSLVYWRPTFHPYLHFIQLR